MQWVYHTHLTEVIESLGFRCRSEVGKYNFLGLAFQVLAIVGIRRSEYGTAVTDRQIASYNISIKVVSVWWNVSTVLKDFYY